METQPQKIQPREKVVFYYNQLDAEKIGYLCERDRIFQQYLDYTTSLQKWSDKKILSEDVDEKHKARKRKADIISHLTMQIDSLKQELHRLDLLISPFEILDNVTGKIDEPCIGT